jgi:hypothetical protein
MHPLSEQQVSAETLNFIRQQVETPSLIRDIKRSLPPDLLQKIKQAAIENGMSTDEEIAGALQDYLDDYESTN